MEPLPVSTIQVSSTLHGQIAYVINTQIKRTLTEFTQVASPLGDPSTIPFNFLRDDELVVSVMPLCENAFVAEYKRQELVKTRCHASADSLWDLCEAH